MSTLQETVYYLLFFYSTYYFLSINGLHSELCSRGNISCAESDLTKIYWNLNGLHQEDPDLIKAIRQYVLVPPDPLPLSMSGPPMKKHLMGQFGQVEVVEEMMLMKKNGFFIEAGAACGEKFSNTLYLELIHKWTGLLVEPNPDLLKLLYSKHRNGWILPHCLSPTPYVQVMDFDVSNYVSGLILEGKIKPSMMDSDFYEKKPKDYEREIKVQCFPLYSVLKALENPKIDYFSLDIEGAEYAVLKTLPWKHVDISVLSVEINHAGEIFDGNRYDIGQFLEDSGYKYIGTKWIDDFYLNKKYMESLKINNN